MPLAPRCRSPPHSVFEIKSILRTECVYETIDMNDFYVDPLLYGNPPQTEVSDEVAEALWQFMRDEQAADRRVRRAKAYISGALAAMLDLGHGSGPMNHMFALKGEFVGE